MERAQHIIGLTAENVKRLTVVQIAIDPNNPAGSVIIKGENGAGKSSVLESIVMALRGGDAILDKPIRDGKDKAVVIIKTEDLIVKRRFTADHNYLEVTNHEGLTYKSPQDLLNGLINTIGFDPMEFAVMDPKKQSKRLLDICPAGLDLEKNAAEQTEVANARRDVNRDLKRLQANMTLAPKPDPELPTTEISVVALSQELAKITDKTYEIARRKDNLEQCKLSLKNIEEKLARLTKDRDQLIKDIEAESARLAAIPDQTELHENLRVQIKNAEATNANIRQASAALKLADEIKALEAKSTEYATKLTAIIKAREDALKAAKFPVPGLSIDQEGHVIFMGNPLKQCSSAEQIRVGIALAAAANPKLKVAFIRHGSLLDAKSMQLVAEIASQHGMQIWIERVEDNSPAAIQIVEGSNIGAKDVPDEPTPDEPPTHSLENGDVTPKPEAAPKKSKKKTNDLFG